MWILVGNYVGSIKPFSADFIPAVQQDWGSKWISLALRLTCSAASIFQVHVFVPFKIKIIIQQQALGFPQESTCPRNCIIFFIWFLLLLTPKYLEMRDRSWNASLKFDRGDHLTYKYSSLFGNVHGLGKASWEVSAGGGERDGFCWCVAEAFLVSSEHALVDSLEVVGQPLHQDHVFEGPSLFRSLWKQVNVWFLNPRKGRWRRQHRGTSMP